MTYLFSHGTFFSSLSEFNSFDGQCFCSSTLANRTSSSINDPQCFQSSKTLQLVHPIYATSYKEFGNRLEKTRSPTNSNSSSIIFFLTVGGRRNLRQIQRLIRAIFSRQHFYLIHVDSVSRFCSFNSRQNLVSLK